MSTVDTVHYEASGDVGRIVFNRPPANAYEINVMQAFNAVLETADADPQVHVVILTSALEKFFCAGSDIKAFQTNDTTANLAMVRCARAATGKMNTSNKIYIAVINGHALGGGLEIALACDLRFAAVGHYQLGLPEINLGLMPGKGGTQRLARLVGASRALAILTTGDAVDPETALQIGLVNRLIPADQLQKETEHYAQNLASGPPRAIAAIKRAVYQGLDLSLPDGLALEHGLADGLCETQDAQEGLRAFIEKRTAHYTGQ